MNTILVCDDERDIVNALRIYLEAEGYRVCTAENGKEALRVFGEQEIDLVLLDIMMPVMDGIEVLAKLREISNVPVLLLTAKSEEADKILGLNVGADDYVTKPFHPAELTARVRSMLRRYLLLGGGQTKDQVIHIGDIQLDVQQEIVTRAGEIVNLTPIEYSILKLLMTNAGIVFSLENIYRQVWKDAPLGADNIVPVHIRHLREKIEWNPAEPRYLKVVWGKGYRFEKENARK